MYFIFIQPSRMFPAIQGYQLGIFSLIAQLRNAGHKAEFLSIGQPEHYEEKFLNPEIDVIGIYTIECMIDEIKRFIKAHRKHHILLGGPTATIAPDYCTKELDYDSLCIGEGDLAIVEFANKFGTPEFKQMKGFWFDNGKIRNETRPRLTLGELQQIEQPLRTEYLTDIQDLYLAMGKRSTSIYATRGCPFSCNYCSNSAYNNMVGIKYRARTPQQVIHEIQTTVDRGRISMVVFEDDILTLDKLWFEQLMRLFKERFYKSKGIRFEMNTRVNCITKDQIKLAADSGCYTIRFGVESGSSYIRSIMGRDGISNDDMINLARTILEHSMCIYYCSIIGVPPETPSMFEETRKVVDNIYTIAQSYNSKCTVILNSFYPLHGTPLGDKCYNEGWVQRRVQGIGAHVDYSLQTIWMDREYVLRQQKLFRQNYTGMIPMAEDLANAY